MSCPGCYIPYFMDKSRASHCSKWEAELQTSTHVTSVFPTPNIHLLQSRHLECFASAITLGPSPRLERQQGHPYQWLTFTVYLLCVWPDVRHYRGGKNGIYNLEKSERRTCNLLRGWRAENQRHSSLFIEGLHSVFCTPSLWSMASQTWYY